MVDRTAPESFSTPLRLEPGAGRPRIQPIRVPRIYAIADVSALGLERVPEAVEIMAGCGIEWIQLRAKGISGSSFYRLVERVLERAGEAAARLWIDDRVDIAALFPVAGVHVGQEDLPPKAARQVVGEGVMVGYSTHRAAQVSAADVDREVDVVALGPIFETRSKERPDPVVGLAGLRQARGLTAKPLVAIGGINARNLKRVFASGADSAVVLGAICHGDVERNCERLLAQAKEAR